MSSQQVPSSVDQIYYINNTPAPPRPMFPKMNVKSKHYNQQWLTNHENGVQLKYCKIEKVFVVNDTTIYFIS